MSNENKEYIISKRAYNWSLEVVNICLDLEKTNLSKIFFSQLVRSSTSVAANLAEADCSLSKKDFIKCVGIAIKECNESKVWLKYIIDLNLLKNQKVIDLLDEAQEIANILGTILVKTKKDTK